MEINQTTLGAATFAMKKAMAMPNTLITLVQNSAETGTASLASQRGSTTPPAPDIPAIPGKGRIDLVI